jgi:hypothetical protein
VSNVVRLRYLYQPGRQASESSIFCTRSDGTDRVVVNAKRAVIWTSIHVTAAFMCACLPLSKPIFVKIGAVSHDVSQYALSLLRSRSGSQQSFARTGRRGPKASSEISIRLDNREYTHDVDIQGHGELLPESRIGKESGNSITVMNSVNVS